MCKLDMGWRELETSMPDRSDDLKGHKDTVSSVWKGGH